MSKTTAFMLALCSAGLSVLFAYEQVYVCLGAAFLLLMVSGGIWAAKAGRDHRLAERAKRQTALPSAPLPPAHPNSKRVYIPSSL